MRKKIFRYWHERWLDKDGNLKDEFLSCNEITDEYEDDVLDVYWRGATAPTTFHCRLYNDTPVESDSLTDLTNELTSDWVSYPLEVERSATGWPTKQLVIAADESATAQAGAAGTITLAAGANASDDFYNRATIKITGGTGQGQIREITDYDGTTKVATVDENWTTNPDNTSVYEVYADWEIVSKVLTFEATAQITDIATAILATTTDNTGLFLVWKALNGGTPRTLEDGEKLEVTIYIKQRGRK